MLRCTSEFEIVSSRFSVWCAFVFRHGWAAATRKVHSCMPSASVTARGYSPTARGRAYATAALVPRAAASTAVGVERRFRGDHFVAHFLAANVEAPIVVYTPLCPVLLKDAAADPPPLSRPHPLPSIVPAARLFPGRKEPRRTFTCEWSATVGDNTSSYPNWATTSVGQPRARSLRGVLDCSSGLRASVPADILTRSVS